MYRGRWTGGHVEPDENRAEAALREVAEETGLAARLLPGPRLDEPDGPPTTRRTGHVRRHPRLRRRPPRPNPCPHRLRSSRCRATGVTSPAFSGLSGVNEVRSPR
ncbi:MAG: NUDIX domain-containing protein [Pseudonocardiaceae bacterium]